jgi:hypothetical protein
MLKKCPAVENVAFVIPYEEKQWMGQTHVASQGFWYSMTREKKFLDWKECNLTSYTSRTL